MRARHTTVVASWRQVLSEAGAEIPDRNVEQMLQSTHVRYLIPQGDQRRLDLVATGLSIDGGVPLFCDVTVVSPITHRGAPRPGTSNSGGNLLNRAQVDNDQTYAEVRHSGLGALYCLGH